MGQLWAKKLQQDLLKAIESAKDLREGLFFILNLVEFSPLQCLRMAFHQLNFIVIH